MSPSNKKLLFVLIPVLILVTYCIITYNGFVKKDESVKRYWNEVQNTYQRRLDLIPNLVGIVKGSSDYEKQVLQKLVEARSKAGSLDISGDVNYNNYQKVEQAQGEVVNSMNRALAVVENYPDLKTTKSYIYLMEQLKGTERRIKVARKDFNESVAVYNVAARNFPSRLVAGIFGFKQKEGFRSDAGNDMVPEVKF